MQCPRCSAAVQNKASHFWLGAIGKAAFPKYVCTKCGSLSIQDFDETEQKKIRVKRAVFGVVFFALLIIAVYAGWSL